MKKISLLLALSAIAFYGCSGAGSKEASQESTEEASFMHEEEDERPPIIMEGPDYRLALPANASDVQCAPVTGAREYDLMWQGYDLIVTPISVTRNGDNHVQLGQPATVRFAIPEDYPKDEYDELVGMLFTDKGTEYKIPDYYALRDGFVQFETSHFCDAAAGREKDSLRARFTAVRAAVQTRKADLMAITQDQINFKAQKDQPNGKKTMNAYLWKVCGDEYDAQHSNG